MLLLTLTEQVRLIMMDSAKLRALLALPIVSTRLTRVRAYAPYQLLTRAYAP